MLLFVLIGDDHDDGDDIDSDSKLLTANISCVVYFNICAVNACGLLCRVC